MAGHDELFINQQTAPRSSETPSPLRINKQGNSTSPAPSLGQQSSAGQPTQQWAQYRVPPSSTATAAASTYGMPSSPPPTGPLPYPDDRAKRSAMPGYVDRKAPSRSATPQEGLDDGTLGYYPSVAVFSGGAIEANFGPSFAYPPAGLAPADGDTEMQGMSDPAISSPQTRLRPVSD